MLRMWWLSPLPDVVELNGARRNAEQSRQRRLVLTWKSRCIVCHLKFRLEPTVNPEEPEFNAIIILGFEIDQSTCDDETSALLACWRRWETIEP